MMHGGNLKLVPLCVRYMFRRVFRPSLGMSTQKSYKVRHNKTKERPCLQSLFFIMLKPKYKSVRAKLFVKMYI